MLHLRGPYTLLARPATRKILPLYLVDRARSPSEPKDRVECIWQNTHLKKRRTALDACAVHAAAEHVVHVLRSSSR